MVKFIFTLHLNNFLYNAINLNNFEVALCEQSHIFIFLNLMIDPLSIMGYVDQRNQEMLQRNNPMLRIQEVVGSEGQ